MSNSVYPSLPGLSFNVQRTIMAPPVSKRMTPSQREFRMRNASNPRYMYELQYEFLRTYGTYLELETLWGFYNQMGGSFDTFLFDDPYDDYTTETLIGVGNGANASWQALRSIGGFTEAVTDIKTTSPTPVVYINGYSANLVNNNSFYLKMSANRPAGFAGYYNGGLISAAFTAPVGFVYTTAVGIKCISGSQTDAFGILANTAGSVDGVTPVGVRAGGWQPNTKYVFSFYAKKINGSDWSKMQLRWNISPAAVVAISNPTLSSSYQLYVFEITWGATVEPYGHFYISVGHADGSLATTVVNDELDLDCLQIALGSNSEVSTYTQDSHPYTINYNSSGVVTFDNPTPSGQVVTWKGGYYRRCRFTEDNLSFNEFMKNFFETKRVTFQSVLGE